MNEPFLAEADPRRPPSPPPLRERAMLLERIRADWIRGVLDHSLYTLARRQLGPADRPGADERPSELILQEPQQRPRWLAPTTAISRVFAELGQSLLILGPPGAGKTTLLLELARDLLAAAERDPSHPMPVVFELTAWATRRQPLGVWLRDELIQVYQVPRKLAQIWLDSGQLLVLLDGLDELGGEHRAAAVNALEDFRRRRPEIGMALCDDLSLAGRLRLGGAVTIQPLTRQRISDLLSLPRQPGIHPVPPHDPSLWELLATPLMLAVLVLASPRPPLWLGKGSLDERRAQLFDHYVRSVLPTDSRFPAREMLAVLAEVARSLEQQGRSLFTPLPSATPSGVDFLTRPQDWPRRLGDWLVRRGHPPLRLVPLLDAVSEGFLLRKTASGYRFAHRLLQSYFATLGPDAIERLGAARARQKSESITAPLARTEDLSRTDNLLSVSDLGVAFGPFKAVDRLSFDLKPGETLGMVGESGSGKTLAALALMRLTPPGSTVTGRIRFAGQELLALAEEDMQPFRGRHLAMIFQEPLSALNPVLSVGEQIAEMFILHENARRKEAWEKAVTALRRVHIAAPDKRARDYPHQLSGGMRQRVMIAMALACRPALLIADEPTTALDVTVQAQILDLLLELQAETAMAMLFISHNLGVIGQIADRVVVLYAGRCVESAPTALLVENPRHPYTQALLATLPRLGERQAWLPAIPGTVPPLDARAGGCAFATRCPWVEARCRDEEPSLRAIDDAHQVACLKVGA